MNHANEKCISQSSLRSRRVEIEYSIAQNWEVSILSNLTPRAKNKDSVISADSARDIWD
jgi:hypothetical protein